MDFDTISNSSGVSNQSDDIRSNASTLSDLSIYQNEFAELRHLVNPTKYPTAIFERCSTPKQDSGCELPYNDRVLDLSNQLQNSLKLNERYKNDLFNLEKIIELRFYDKVEKLLRNNNRLKSELDKANEQIERLIRSFSTKSDTSPLLNKNFIQLEQKCHDLSVENAALRYDLLESKNEKEEYTLENKQLKIELNELKIDINAKNVCIKQLKERISEQHVEIQTLLKNNLLSSHSIKEISSDLELLKKAQKWYKDQLHIYQNEKRVLSDEILTCKTDLSSQKENSEILNVELAKWKHKCDIIQLEALKEKERLCKEIENINFTNICNNQPESNFAESDKSIVNYYETSIQDLTNEIAKVKEYVQEQDKTCKNITKENSELIAHCIMLQKTIQQNEMSIEDLQNSKKYLNMELNLMKDRVKEKSEEVTCSKEQIFNLEAELTARNQERELVENTISTIREQFTCFKVKYEKIKEEILNKNREILQLQNEKQKLFMNNNWNICELEKTKEKDVIIDKLKFEITSYEQNITKHFHEIKRLENELNEKEDVCINLQKEKQSVIDKHTVEIQKYENVLSQYKVMVTDYDNRIDDLQILLRERNDTVKDLNDNIEILKEEVRSRDSDFNQIQNKYAALENNFRLISSENSTKTSKTDLTVLKKSLNGNDYKLIEALKHFMVIQNSNGTNYDNGKNYNYNLRETIDVTMILNKIDNYLQDNFSCKIVKDTEDGNKQFRMTIHRLKNDINSRLMKLEERMKILHRKNEECYKMLNSIINSQENVKENIYTNKKIQELNVLLQVKELEIKEKQKKYETNNRTLLKKVKEHMKGRNHAEKQNKYLQELYNSLSDENNSLKIMISSKEYETENIKRLLESYTSINDKLKQSVSKLEEKANRNVTCDKCLEYLPTIKRLQLLEDHIKELEDEKIRTQDILMKKEEIVVNFQKEIQDILLKNSSLVSDKNRYTNRIEKLESDKKKLTNEIEVLESELNKKQLLIDDFNEVIQKENAKCLESNCENNQLKKHLDELNAKIEYFSGEMKILNSTLQGKCEELNRLEDNKHKMEINFNKKDQDSQNIIGTLKNHLHKMQVEITSVHNEKYFLQRLCSDLKLALKTHVNHNKLLKEQLNKLPKEKQDFNSLPNILPDISNTSKYDQAYINRLLQQNRAPLQDKPLTEIKGCLDSLRKEISTLQEQITKKNTHFV